MAIVVLLRHGRTTANSSGTLAGWTPGVDLDDTGHRQVATAAERLAGVPFVRAVTSPLQRCRSTAQGVLAGRSVPLVTDDRLGEARYGSWTGRSLVELATEPLWRIVQDQPSAAVFPGGGEFEAESLQAMATRAVAAVREIDAAVTAEHGPDACWLAVSHGDVIKAILADAAGSHLDHFQRWQVDPCSVSVVRHTDSRPFLLRVNDTGAAWRPPAARADGSPAGDGAVGGGAGEDGPQGPGAAGPLPAG